MNKLFQVLQKLFYLYLHKEAVSLEHNQRWDRLRDTAWYSSTRRGEPGLVALLRPQVEPTFPAPPPNPSERSVGSVLLSVSSFYEWHVL